MEDYTLCTMCQRVTVEAMKSPAGFEHYNNLLMLYLHKGTCRLCSLMYDALSAHRRNIPKIKSCFDINWTVRLWLGDLTEWLYQIETDTEEGPFPDMGLVIVVVTCLKGSFCNSGWRTEEGENAFHGTIEVCGEEVYRGLTSPKRLKASSSSDTSFSIVRDWINECTADHDKCKEMVAGVATRFLPPRLIDVGPCEGSQHPYLCIVGEELKSQRDLPHYIALSYCWGGRGNVWTTSRNILERRKAIDIDHLPQTIRDAIQITRELGVQYLWVDALCILQGQDDEDARIDWQQHSAIMGDIYGNSFVTIAAAAAAHADIGIFSERRLPRYCRVPFSTGNQEEFIDLCSDENRTHNKKDPLSERSWALQEKILSKRVVSYETGQILWGCSEFTVREDGTNTLKFSDILASYAPSTWDSTWRSFVTKYSETKLTFEKDKLPALSGLVRVLQHRNKDQYLAGLWKNAIYDELLWINKDVRVRRPSRYRAPSWSWAAIDGKVGWMHDTLRLYYDDETPVVVKHLAQLLDWGITLAGPDTFGEVSDAFLLIHGTLKTLENLEIRAVRKGRENRYNIHLFRKPVHSELESLGTIYPDTMSSFNQVQCNGELLVESLSKLFLLPIQSASGVYLGLVLSYNDINELSYRRVGLFDLCPKDDKFWHDDCLQRDIRIE